MRISWLHHFSRLYKTYYQEKKRNQYNKGQKTYSQFTNIRMWKHKY